MPGLTWSRAGRWRRRRWPSRAAAAPPPPALGRRRRWRRGWGGGAVERRIALKGAGATGVRTSPCVWLSRRIRWGMGKQVASPRGQNQEGSQMEEENRSQKETETSVTWGMAVGPKRRTWEGSACAPGAPAKILSQSRAGKAVRVTTPRRNGRCRRRNSRPILQGLTHSGPTR